MGSIPKHFVQSMHSNTNSGQVILPVDYHNIYLKSFFFLIQASPILNGDLSPDTPAIYVIPPSELGESIG